MKIRVIRGKNRPLPISKGLMSGNEITNYQLPGLEYPRMNEKLKPILTALRDRFEALYGPRLTGLILYGSQARGDAEPGSDIDVLVVLEGPVNPGEEIERTGEIVAQLSLEHEGSSRVFS